MGFFQNTSEPKGFGGKISEQQTDGSRSLGTLRRKEQGVQ